MKSHKHYTTKTYKIIKGYTVKKIQKQYTPQQVAWMKTKERQAFKAICKKHREDKLKLNKDK